MTAELAVPDVTLQRVWLARCWSCGWQRTYARQPYAKGALTRHTKQCPRFAPPAHRSWWKP